MHIFIKKKSVVLFMFFLVHQGSYGQKLCKGILLDSLTKQAIEYANIGIVGKGVGTVTDDKGEYSFSIPDSLLDQNIKISMIGYRSKIYPATGFEKLSKVHLAQNITSLHEVSVTAKKTKIKILGNQTKTKAVSGGFNKNSLGSEIAVKLNIKRPQTHIKKFMFNINKNSLNIAPIFRVNMYNADDNGYPNENILAQNIIIAPKEMIGFVEIDLTPYSIFVDKDVFISIEWIKDLGDVRGLYFSTKMVGGATYFRRTSQDKWGKTSPIGLGLFAEVAY